jgi:hypothetical protein
MHKRTLTVGIALLLILLTTSSPGWAAPLMQARSVITYPTDGTTISGVVEVRGIATHPNLDFYQVRYAAGSEPTGNSQWVDFAIVDGTQVENDVLGAWDTTVIPDGEYTLALAVWGVDDSAGPYVFFVTRVIVNNAQPVASPTPSEPTATPEPMPTAVIGPTPTPVSVEQPATPTPRPSPTPRSGEDEETITPAGGEGDRFNVPLDVSELRTAFCTGGLITVMLLSVWGFYLLAKAGVRWALRQQRTKPPSG